MKCEICGEVKTNSTEVITDNKGTTYYCPNCMVDAYIGGKLDFENNPEFIDDITGEHGAVKYERGDEQYVLEKETMLRLIGYNLDPDEYFALVEKYGNKQFMLHDDFYDEFDGGAIQPLDDQYDDDYDDDEYDDEQEED